MKSFIVLFAVVAVAVADVSHLKYASGGADKDAQTLREDADVRPDGFNYAFETSNGIAAQAAGAIKNVGNEVALDVQGSNQYTGPDGVAYAITYVANENGYQPQGAHLPTPPPPQAIPDYILRSIKYNEEHQEKTPAQQFNRFQ